MNTFSDCNTCELFVKEQLGELWIGHNNCAAWFLTLCTFLCKTKFILKVSKQLYCSARLLLKGCHRSNTKSVVWKGLNVSIQSSHWLVIVSIQSSHWLTCMAMVGCWSDCVHTIFSLIGDCVLTIFTLTDLHCYGWQLEWLCPYNLRIDWWLCPYNLHTDWLALLWLAVGVIVSIQSSLVSIQSSHWLTYTAVVGSQSDCMWMQVPKLYAHIFSGLVSERLINPLPAINF